MKRLITLTAACLIAAPVFAQTVATVNGKTITQKNVDSFVQLLIKQGATDSPQLRDQVTQELIDREVFVEAADKQGISKQPEVQTELNLARQGILVKALMDDYLAKHPVTDAQVQAQYDKVKASQADQLEYKVRHILVKDKETADKLLANIQSKKISFEDAAKQNSIDKGSAEQGGELGWAPATNYVPPFAQAVESLKKGELDAAPVQTQFGWHIIQVEDTRAQAFPALDTVRPQIEQMLRQQALEKYEQDLRSKASIKVTAAPAASK